LKQSEEKTAICKLCFNEIGDSLFNILHKSPTICQKCFSTFNPKLKHFKVDGVRVDYIFDYDEIVREQLYKFKGCFDIELSTIFLERFKTWLMIKYFGYVIVPAPSYSEADDVRGFNHVVEIFKVLNKPIFQCIKKTKNIKQADLSAKERESIKNYLVIDDLSLNKKKILIVDDVFTTGSTVKRMIELVKTKKPKKIRVLTMSKTIDFDERKSK